MSAPGACPCCCSCSLNSPFESIRSCCRLCCMPLWASRPVADLSPAVAVTLTKHSKPMAHCVVAGWHSLVFSDVTHFLVADLTQCRDMVSLLLER